MKPRGMHVTLRYRWLRVLKGNPTPEQLERFNEEITKFADKLHPDAMRES